MFEEGRDHHDLLINKLISQKNPNIQEIVEIFKHVWNNFPRWELGGRIPCELGETRKSEGLPPALHAYHTRFDAADNNPAQTKKEKIGRNEFCPCGSGKKYKKCCGK